MSFSNSGLRVYQQIKDYLDKRDFHYETHDDQLLIQLTVKGDDRPQPTIIRVIDERQVFQVLSPIPCVMPEDKLVDGALAVSVANDRMLNGSFDYNTVNGRIAYRVTQAFMGMEVSEECIEYVLNVAFFTTDKYNDKFFMISKGMMTLEQFLEQESQD